MEPVKKLSILLVPGLELLEETQQAVSVSLTGRKDLVLCSLLPLGGLRITTLPSGSPRSSETNLDGPFTQFLWEDAESSEDVWAQCPRILTLRQDNQISVHELTTVDWHMDLSTVCRCDEDTLRELCADNHVCIPSLLSVRLLSLQGNRLLLLLSSCVLLRLCCAGRGQAPQLLSCFSLDLDAEAAERVSGVCLSSGVLFLLDSSGFVYVYDTVDGSHVAVVELPPRPEECASDPLSSVRVSPDLSLAVVSSATRWALPLRLSEYFRLNPGQLLCAWPGVEMPVSPGLGIDEDELSSCDLSMRVLGHPFRTDRSWEAAMSSLYNKTRSGTDALVGPRAQPLWPQSLPSHEPLVSTLCEWGSRAPMEGGWLSVSPKGMEDPMSLHISSVCPFSAMFCARGGDGDLTVTRWDAETQGVTHHALGRALPVDCAQYEACLVITDRGLSLVMFAASQDEFLSRLMIHGNASTVDALCHLNHWGRCSVPIHTLEAGLANRQLDTVDFFLKSKENVLSPVTSGDSSETAAGIQSERYLNSVKNLLPALDLLSSYIRDTDQETQSKHFSEQLLQLTLCFLNRQVQALCTHLSEPDAALQDCVRILSSYITALRPFMKRFFPRQQQALRAGGGTRARAARPSAGGAAASRNHVWEELPAEHIISDAILTNRIPEAQTFLRVRGHHHASSLTRLKREGLHLVYRRLLETRVQEACQLLRNMGFSVWTELHLICLHTSDRSVRTLLVDLLQGEGYFSEREQEEIRTVHKVEELYCDPLRSSTGEKRSSAGEKRSSAGEKRSSAGEKRCAEQPRPGWRCRAASQEHAMLQRVLATAGDDPDTLLLYWAQAWDTGSQEAILLPRRPHQDLCFSRPHVLWHHLTLWHAWPRICSWMGGLGPCREIDDTDPSHWPPLTPAEVDGNTMCCDYTRQRVLDRLARAGLLVPSELQDFEGLVERLAVSGGLMQLPGAPQQSAAPEGPDFHTRFVLLCAERGLQYLLYTYLDYHRLHPDVCAALASAALQEALPWLGFLMQIRGVAANPLDHSRIFYASIANAHMVMPGYQPSMSSMLLEGHTLLALATNMYAPGGINRVLGHREDLDACHRNVDPELLKMAVTPYPKLKSALFSPLSVHSVPPPDISLYHLLQALSPFHPTRFFTWQTANTFTAGDTSSELPHFSCPGLVSKFSAVEQLDAWFFLRSGRPAFAFATFLLQQLLKSKTPQQLVQQAADEAYAQALSSFHVPSVVTACVCFLELLGLSSHKLRVDVNVANLILRHAWSVQEVPGHGSHTQALAERLSRLLESETEAAKDLLLSLEEAVSTTVQREQTDSPSLSVLPWGPVLQFCRLHSIPLSSRYLRSCAQGKDWLQLLVHTHTREQVSCVLGDLSPALRDHVTVALEGVSSDAERAGCALAGGAAREPSTAILYHVLLRCQEREQPGRVLLTECVRRRAPVLSVLAACVQNADRVSCLCVWVITSVDPATCAEITHTLPAPAEHAWELQDLTRIWDTLLRREESKILQRAFSIFMEDCPLLLLLDVYQLCLQHKNYTEAAERLRDFQSSLLSLQSAGVSPAASPPASWLQVRASQLLQLLILQSRTPYERRKVLQLLCDGASQWVGEALDVHKLSALAQILREQPLSISQELLSEYSAAGLRVECQRLLQILQDGGHFSLARKVAELAELPTDSLVIEEVLKDQRLLQQVGQWQSPQSRAHYWRKCHQTFSTHQLSPGAASGFFRSQAAGHLAPGPLVPEQAEGLAEKELLLTLAGHWLSLSDCAPSPALEELEQQIWECRITREVVSRRAGGMSRLYRPHPAGTVPSFSSLATLYSFSSLPALNCPLLLDISRLPPLHGAHAALDAARTQALSSLIDRLLDESRVHEASRVCKYFQLPHRDLRLALNCRALATGETARDQLHPDIQAILMEGREAQESVWNRRKRLQRSSSQERAPPGGGSPQPMDPLLRDLEILKDECIHGKIFCRQLLCVYELSQDLGCSFSDVSSRDAGEILRSLLSCRRPPPDLSDRAQAVISSHGIPPHTVAQIVAEEGLRSWRVLGEERGQAHVYNASEIRRSFLQLAKLCPDPTLVGLKLLDNLGSVPLTQPHCIIELLISAHDCFSLTCHLEGIGRVLQACRHLTELHLAPSHEYSLMVRLLSGIGRYNDMTYVFDILHQNQHFEALLRKQLDTTGGLQTALLEYIKRCHPGDSEKHNLTALCFSLHRDIGHNHEHAALIQLRLIQSRPWELWMSDTEELRSALMKALTLLIDAAESYSKESCVRQSLRCARLSRLLTLQLHLLNSGQETRLINLDRESLMVSILAVPRFYQATILAEAYDLVPDWAEVLYHKVIVEGDFQYLEELKQRQLLRSGVFEQISNKCKFQPPGAPGMQHLKQLLSYCEDSYTCYKLAFEHQFYDVTDILMKDSQTRCCLTDMLSR